MSKSGTPTLSLAEVARHAVPVEVIPGPITAWRYDARGNLESPEITLPPGTKLIGFFRPVALAWIGKYGGQFPCDVLTPDGSYTHLCIDPARAIELVPSQPHYEWDAERQIYVTSP